MIFVLGLIIFVDLFLGGGFEEVEIVFILGGNIFEFFGILCFYGFLKNLEEFFVMGGKLYGGSVGVIFVGVDIGFVDVECGGLDKNMIGF